MSQENYSHLEILAKSIRTQTFEMVLKAGKGHLGGSFSSVEILVALYHGKILNYDAHNPDWEERDRLIFSKGHANNSLYVVLADLGFYPLDEVRNFTCNGSILGNHCDMIVPGIDVTSGSLGHGLSIGAGLAWGAKLSNRKYKTYVIIGDGESQEGSIWEAMMFAAHRKLDNLVCIVDRNKLGSEDFTKDSCSLENFFAKWQAFGWHVKEINGHSFSEIFDALSQKKNEHHDKPLVVIANTIKCKGISCLENKPKAHHTLPAGDEILQTRKDLR